MRNLIKIIHNFKNIKIMVVGDLILDEFIYGNVERISPEAPVPVVWAKEKRYMPGGACNVASNITSLGAKASLVGVVGRDHYKDILFRGLKKWRIGKEGIFSDSRRRTTLKTRIIGQHQQMVRVDWEDQDGVLSSLREKLIGFIKRNLNKFDAIIIEDYGKGVVDASLLASIGRINKAKKIITVDPKEEHFGMYRSLNITAITPNRKEAENAIRNIKVKDKKNRLNIHTDKLAGNRELNLAGKELLKYWNAKCVLMTLGEEGMRLFKKGSKPVHIPTVAREVFDVSGAGDTVIATFTLSLAAGATMQEAAYLSNYAAGIVVGEVGIATVTPKELLSRINK